MSAPRSAVVVALVLALGAASAGATLRVISPACQRTLSPIAVSTAHPLLSWQLASDRRGDRPTGCEIEAATDLTSLQAGRANLWRSGRLAGPRAGRVWAGRPLRSGAVCWWRARAWDADGRPGPWSDAARFEMGLLEPAAWRGHWIGDGRPEPTTDAARYGDEPAPLFRRTFRLTAPVRRARLHIAGLGLYAARVNGRAVGSEMLQPLWTDYRERVLSATYDVTDQLHPGENAIGVELGNGWWNPLPLRLWGWLNLRDHLPTGRPCLLAQLMIETADGAQHTIATDPSWRWREGPRLRNNLYLGELYDARREVDGWDRSGMAGVGWRPAVTVRGPGGRVVPGDAPPIRVIDTITPPAPTRPRPGVWIYDMGRNLAGIVRLRVRGQAGDRITLRFGELLHADGTLNPMTAVCGQIKGPGAGGPGAPAVAVQADTFVLAGRGAEEFVPAFTFHAFRYVEVTGDAFQPAPGAIEGKALSCDLVPGGSVRTSSARLNRVQEMVANTFRSNLLGVQSDCPGRERLGYGGDLAATSGALLMNYEIDRLYAKIARDFGDAARHAGGWMTETAPSAGMADGGFRSHGGDPGSGPISWGMAHPLLLSDLIRYAGDTELAHEQYPAARRYLELIRVAAPDHTLENCIGDHEALDRCEAGVAATISYYRIAVLVRDLAARLGIRADRERYSALAAAISRAFAARFVAGPPGRVGAGSQAAQALALACGILPSSQREPAFQRLVEGVERARGKLTTGIFGTRAILEALSAGGRYDLALRMVNHDDFPGWGYMLRHGATTLWENWAGSDNTFSQNHPMFGSVSEWLYRWVAGLAVSPGAVGFDHVHIEPGLGPGLTSARAMCYSVLGSFQVSWRAANGRLTLEAQLPPGATADVFLPTTRPADVREGAEPAARARCVRFVGVSRGRCMYRIGSGVYRFTAPLAAQ